MRIRVVVTGRDYHTAAGLPDEVALPESATVDDALSLLAEHLPGGQTFPASCLVAVSGEHLGTVGDHPPRTLADGDELILIAPVAGG
jgi:molybdopterin converting factor small subunit